VIPSVIKESSTVSKIDLDLVVHAVDLEEEVFEVEGVRIVIRTAPSTRVVCGYKALFKRNLGDDRQLSLLVNRIQRIVGEGVHVEVIDGKGQRPSHSKTLLGKLRASYVKK